MNEQDFARGVTRHLDAGVDALPSSVLYRLRAAREAALASAEKPGSTAGRRAPMVRLLAPAAMLVLLVVGVLVWQQQPRHADPGVNGEFADVDTKVLTDDLPVVAYLDPGFEIWLYHHAPATAED